jgi:hypothetical protein
VPDGLLGGGAAEHLGDLRLFEEALVQASDGGLAGGASGRLRP